MSIYQYDSDYDMYEMDGDDDDGEDSCNICGHPEIAGTASLQGVPWAFNVCNSPDCYLTAVRRLHEELEELMTGAASE